MSPALYHSGTHEKEAQDAGAHCVEYEQDKKFMVHCPHSIAHPGTIAMIQVKHRSIQSRMMRRRVSGKRRTKCRGAGHPASKGDRNHRYQQGPQILICFVPEMVKLDNTASRDRIMMGSGCLVVIVAFLTPPYPSLSVRNGGKFPTCSTFDGNQGPCSHRDGTWIGRPGHE